MSDQPPEGKYVGWLNAVKGLTLANVLVIAGLGVIAAPLYVIWKALNDEKILDRLMSQYEELGVEDGCLLRHVQMRGGPSQWGISNGFAYQGADRWFVSVILPREPSQSEIASYCQSLKLLADQVLARRDLGPDGTPPGP